MLLTIKKLNMKTIYKFNYLPVLLVVCIGVIMASCGGPKATTSDVKMLTLTTPHNKILNGYWTVDSVRVDSNFTAEEANKIVLFEDAEAACYIGGQWMIGDDGEGTYTVAGTDCTKGTRGITWNILKGDHKHFIAFVRNRAPKDVVTAKYTTYSVQISQINKNTMLLKYPVKFNDKTANMFIRLHKSGKL